MGRFSILILKLEKWKWKKLNNFLKSLWRLLLSTWQDLQSLGDGPMDGSMKNYLKLTHMERSVLTEVGSFLGRGPGQY